MKNPAGDARLSHFKLLLSLLAECLVEAAVNQSGAFISVVNLVPVGLGGCVAT